MLSLTLGLLLGGDIELNPSPITYLCGECEKAVAANHRALQCDGCDQWIHIKCCNVKPKDYAVMCRQESISWICDHCSLPNFSDSFFNDSVTDINNSFAAPANSSETSEENEQTDMHQNNANPANGKHINKDCSRQQYTKKHRTLHGTESHLDSTVKDGKFFPPSYDIYYKDRNSCGGAVFLVVDKSLVSSESDIDCNSESVWAKLQVKGSPAVILGAHY